jgi:hypothetical protein
MKKLVFMLIPVMLLMASCRNMDTSIRIPSEDTKSINSNSSRISAEIPKVSIINEKGTTIIERFKVPEGFERASVPKDSFQEFLRNQKLRPQGSKVRYYDGNIKDKAQVYEAVLEVDIGQRDLHQCADAVMLLRAEYFYKNKRYEDIHFNFTNGFQADYLKWAEGYRIKVNGNSASWIKSKGPSKSYEVFRQYMDMVFAYAGTLSLEKELDSRDIQKMKIGDVFIKGASPGHAVIVMDMAENPNTKEKLFMLAQSYMPAQETQVLCNPNNPNFSPWYSLDFQGDLVTPEWTFTQSQFKSFKE